MGISGWECAAGSLELLAYTRASSAEFYIFEWQFLIFAFVKERFHNAVEIDILGIFEVYSLLQIWPPKKFFRGEIIQGE